MDLAHFESLAPWTSEAPVIEAHQVTGPLRTLLLGYTCDRAVWHVYFKDGLIHQYVYGKTEHVAYSEHAAHVKVAATDLIPDKRVYPESTDYVFALILKRLGVDVPYTRFDSFRYAEAQGKALHGEIA
jgi:hypothetical protein